MWKKSKRTLSLFLCLIMTLSLVPTAFAAPIDGTEPKTSVQAEANDLNITKKVVDNGDGTYDLVMEAFATGTSQVTTVSKPLDIVLVLDVSGSMNDETTTRTYTAQDSKDYSYKAIDRSPTQYYYKDSNGQYYPVYAGYNWHLFSPDEYYLYYRVGNRNYRIGDTVTSQDQTIYSGVLYTVTVTTATKMESMKAATKKFIDTVAADATASNVNHRISVVKFAGTKKGSIGNDFYWEGVYEYNNSQTVIGLTDAKTGATTLNAKVDDLRAGGATRADFGMQLADGLLANTSADRQKVVVMFTDGEPTNSNSFQNSVANGAISAAKTMKNSGTMIYTVGMIANPSANVQNFLDYVSSNYPNAKSMSKPGQKIAEGAYSSIVSDGAGLDDVFQKIANEAVSSASAANESSSITDTLSSYFNFKLTDDDELAKCIVQKVPCTGENTWGTPEDITSEVSIIQNGKDIQVSGYNYTDANNLVVQKADGSWQGYKLVLTFSIVPDADAEWQAGTHYYPTNNTDNSKAGIYAEDGTEILALTESPEAPVTAAKVIYQVTGDKPATSDALPNEAVYLANKVVSVADGLTTTETTKDGKTGVWTFNGWDRSGDFIMPGTDVVITGTWSFTYTEKTDVTMTKVWDDDNNRDGVRPESISVQLLDSENNVVGNPVTLTAQNAVENGNWTYTWNVMKYDANGNEISYHVAEVSSDNNYTSAVSGMTITNTHEVSRVDVTMTKIWDDDNNRDGVRPESIDVQLYANGVPCGDVVTVKADGNGTWTHTWNGLHANDNGEAITYTVQEVSEDENYKPSYSEDTLTITNLHTVATTDKTVTKVWDDDNNRDGLRPETVVVNLLANGEVVNEAELSSANQWTYTWKDLYVNDGGEPITYTVEEVDVAGGYDAKAEGMAVGNIHKPATIRKTVTKIWNDDENHDGLRPETVTINLLANGKVLNKVELSSANQWTYTWEGLYVNDGGKPIVYTVEEVNVDENYTVSYDVDANGGLIVTNTHIPETVDICVEKIWKGDAEANRPKDITVNILANGEIVESVSLTAENNWVGALRGMPVYKNGKKIVYSVEEKTVTGYTATYSANTNGTFVITNTWNIVDPVSPPESPKTGDTGHVFLWLALLFISGGAVIGTMVISRKKKCN